MWKDKLAEIQKLLFGNQQQEDNSNVRPVGGDTAFDVNVSAPTTLKGISPMAGMTSPSIKLDSLQRSSALTSPEQLAPAEPEPVPMQIPPQPMPASMPSSVPSSVPPTHTPHPSSKPLGLPAGLESLLKNTDLDKENALRARIEKQAPQRAFTQLGGGVIDALNRSHEARFGVKAPDSLQDYMINRSDSVSEKVMTDMKAGHKSDPASGISHQYQQSAKLLLGDEAGKWKGLYEGKSAEQIGSVLPIVEKYMISKENRESKEALAEANRLEKQRQLTEKSDAKAETMKNSKDVETINTNMTLEGGIEEINRAISKTDRVSAGAGQKFTGFLPGTKELKGHLDTLSGQIMIQVMTSMKKASQALGGSGTGMGAMSDAEGAALKKSIASLDQDLPAPQLRENLAKVKMHMERLKALVNMDSETLRLVADAYKRGDKETVNQYLGEIEESGDNNTDKQYSQTATNPKTGERMGTMDGKTWEKIS